MAEAASPRPKFMKKRETQTPTVMVVGKSGMGKSTLCNYLLYGKPRQPEGLGFKVAPGSDAVTFACQKIEVASTPPPRRFTTARGGGPLIMIDTPGIPDPGGRTLEFYNQIVLEARRVGALNTLIIAVIYTSDRMQIQQDFEKYGILLKQFSKLTCSKILLCRYKMQPDLEAEEEKAETEVVEAWARGLMTLGDLAGTTLTLLKEDDSMSGQIFGLRQALCSMPQATIQEFNMRTFDELRDSVERLTMEEGGRVEELKTKKIEFEAIKQQLQSENAELRMEVPNVRKGGNLAAAVLGVGGLVLDVMTGLVSVGSVSAAAAALGAGAKTAAEARASILEAKIIGNYDRIEKIDKEVADIEDEVETGNPNKEAIARDNAELQALKSIA